MNWLVERPIEVPEFMLFLEKRFPDDQITSTGNNSPCLNIVLFAFNAS
jgi:hypothetical protein